MKMTKAQLEKAIFETVENESLAGDLGVRIVANAFVKYAGIEIVPDPEPTEYPMRPLTVLEDNDPAKSEHGFYAIKDAADFWIARLQVYTGCPHDESLFPQALVSAYNAAGERKGITVRVSREAEPNFGKYIIDCADRLGLEIVES